MLLHIAAAAYLRRCTPGLLHMIRRLVLGQWPRQGSCTNSRMQGYRLAQPMAVAMGSLGCRAYLSP